MQLKKRKTKLNCFSGTTLIKKDEFEVFLPEVYMLHFEQRKHTERLGFKPFSQCQFPPFKQKYCAFLLIFTESRLHHQRLMFSEKPELKTFK